MLPKKRKFTPTEYQTWIPEPPEAHQSSVQSSRSQEDNEVAINLVRSEVKATTLDLAEWIGHRILARRDDFFCPGKSTLVKMISFPRVTLDIHFAALLERALLWYAHIAATVEAAQALLWTVWAGKARWW